MRSIVSSSTECNCVSHPSTQHCYSSSENHFVVSAASISTTTASTASSRCSSSLPPQSIASSSTATTSLAPFPPLSTSSPPSKPRPLRKLLLRPHPQRPAIARNKFSGENLVQLDLTAWTTSATSGTSPARRTSRSTSYPATFQSLSGNCRLNLHRRKSLLSNVDVCVFSCVSRAFFIFYLPAVRLI